MQNQQVNTPHQEAQPLVSFIITYYDLPIQMLCECIDSILALSLRPFEREIIVVDDGSETSPINGLMEYGDNIIYLRQKNSGVSVARNQGLQMAKGKYIQFVDGDDCLIQTPYEHCLDIIRYHQDADMVFFDFTHSRSHQEEAYKQPTVTNGIEYLHHQNIRGASWCFLFRQSIRGSLEFTPGVAYGEDEEFTPQLLIRAETIYLVEAKAYYYRTHSQSAVHQLSEEKKLKRLDDTIGIILHLHDLCDKLPPHAQSAMQRRVAQLTMDYIYNIMMLTRSNLMLEERLEALKSKGLFPLPDRDYTQKYRWFRKMANTAVGRRIMLHTLPLLKKER